MANFLRNIGLFAFRHKWWVIGFWLVIVAIAISLMLIFRQPVSSTISIPGTEAQTTIDTVEKMFPNAGGGTGRIVFEAPHGKTIDDFKPVIETTLAEVTKVKDVKQVISPFTFSQAISEDRTIAYAQLQLSVNRTNVSDQTASEIAALLDTPRNAGLTTEAGGDIVRLAPDNLIGIGEVVGVIVAAIVLIVFFRTLLAAGLPLAVALVTLAVGVSGIMAMSSVVDINVTTPVLAIMLGLAVGIDYSLFILSRYRGYLLEGDTPQEAIASAVGTAGNAVVFAALTVIIALSALSVIQIPLLTIMGLAAAGTVAIAALAAITLLPAFTGIIGDRVLAKKHRHVFHSKTKHHELHIDKTSNWYKFGTFLTKHPLPIIIVAVVVLASLAYPIKDLHLGLPTDEYAASDTTQRKAYDILSRGFGAGFNGPLIVLAEGLKAPTDQEVLQTAKALTTGNLAIPAELQAMASAQAPNQPSDPLEISRMLLKYKTTQDVATQLAKTDGVVRAIPTTITDDGTAALLQVIPETGPSDNQTVNLIQTIRDQTITVDESTVNLSVTGTTAIQLDIDQKMLHSFAPYLGITVGLSFLILLVAFRSILVPLKATIGFLLSIGAMFGALVIVFQWGAFGLFEPTPIISFLPIIGIGILFGLAMDYEFFMTSSIRESYLKTKNGKQSVKDGFSVGAKVVTAAGIIMVSVFGGFMTNSEDIIKQIGFGLAFGILIDAFIIRMIVGPAVMSLLGNSAWHMPKWLKKLVPKITIEGKE